MEPNHKHQDGSMTAWVLWHQYHDGSGAHIERVYFDEARAIEDHLLLVNQPGGGTEWKLDVVPVYGLKLVRPHENSSQSPTTTR